MCLRRLMKVAIPPVQAPRLLSLANNMWLYGAGSSKVIFVSAAARRLRRPGAVCGRIISASGSTVTLDFRAVSSSVQGSNTISGVISGTGINYVITNANVGTSKTAFTGANTYTGTTTIGAPSTGGTCASNAWLQIWCEWHDGNLGTGRCC